MADLSSLLGELDRLHQRTVSAPWRVATSDDVANDWPVANCGRAEGSGNVWVATDHISASATNVHSAEDDAAFIVALRNAWPVLREALRPQVEPETPEWAPLMEALDEMVYWWSEPSNGGDQTITAIDAVARAWEAYREKRFGPAVDATQEAPE